MKRPSTDVLSPRGQRIALLAAVALLMGAIALWAVRAVVTADQFGWGYVLCIVAGDIVFFVLLALLLDRRS